MKRLFFLFWFVILSALPGYGSGFIMTDYYSEIGVNVQTEIWIGQLPERLEETLKEDEFVNVKREYESNLWVVSGEKSFSQGYSCLVRYFFIQMMDGKGCIHIILESDFTRKGGDLSINRIRRIENYLMKLIKKAMIVTKLEGK